MLETFASVNYLKQNNNFRNFFTLVSYERDIRVSKLIFEISITKGQLGIHARNIP